MSPFRFSSRAQTLPPAYVEIGNTRSYLCVLPGQGNAADIDTSTYRFTIVQQRVPILSSNAEHAHPIQMNESRWGSGKEGYTHDE